MTTWQHVGLALAALGGIAGLVFALGLWFVGRMVFDAVQMLWCDPTEED